MAVIEQCRIDPEGKYLIIEACVENLDYYENVYIDKVIIHTDENFPSDKPNDKTCVWPNELTLSSEKKFAEGTKEIRLCLTAKDLKLNTLNDNIFFVYIITAGTVYPEPLCGMDHDTVMGVAVNLRPIYNLAMQYVKQLDNSCVIPKGFIDMVLRLKAFDISLKTGNFETAIKYWQSFLTHKIPTVSIKNCGCR